MDYNFEDKEKNIDTILAIALVLAIILVLFSGCSGNNSTIKKGNLICKCDKNTTAIKFIDNKDYCICE